MSETLRCVCLSFDNSSIEIRERATISESELPGFLQHLLDHGFASEFLVLSTCNRTEAYYISVHDRKDLFVESLASFKGNPSLAGLKPSFKSLTDPRETIERLFRVGNGLLSQVMGDFQIIRQVKDAYEIASQSGSIGRHFHRIFQLLFASHKDISNRTNIHAGCASVSAAEVVRKFAGSKDASILVIGAGKFSIEVIEQLLKKNFRKITVANRNNDKAIMLAVQYKINWRPFGQLNDLSSFDVITTCISNTPLLITEDLLKPSTEPKLLVDLSVPRVIDPALAHARNARLINLDGLREENDIALKFRSESIPEALKIIEAYCEEFYDWQASAASRPVLKSFKTAIERIRFEEVSRYLRKSRKNEVDAYDVEAITKNIINKITRLPAVKLNEMTSGAPTDREKLTEALAQLFNLEVDPDLLDIMKN